MSRFLEIRYLLSLTQMEMAEALGCSMSNVSFLDRGQTITPTTGKRLIAAAAELGVELTFDHLYGHEPLPRLPPRRPRLKRIDWRQVMADLDGRGWTKLQLSAQLGIRLCTLVELASGALEDPQHAVGASLSALHASGTCATGAKKGEPCAT